MNEFHLVTFHFNQKTNKYVSLFDAKSKICRCRKNRVIKKGGTIGHRYLIAPDTYGNGYSRTIAERTVIARDRALGIALFRGCNPNRYVILICQISVPCERIVTLTT
jgi:hypothetical protein